MIRRTQEDPAGGPSVNRRALVALAAGLGVGIGTGSVTGLGGCTAAAVRTPRASPTRTLKSAPIRYAFSDEFNGPAGIAPDPSKWSYDLGGGGWGNDELEVYTDSRANSFLDGKGSLVIRATKQVTTSGGRRTTTYASARLKTVDTFSKYLGTFEARIKLNPQPGLWPAWWALGANFEDVGWPQCGEVDMLENYGGSSVESSVHTPSAATGEDVLTRSQEVSCDAQWHVWRMAWDRAGGFTFFKDGAQYLDVLPQHLANWRFGSGVPLFMVLNLAVGGLVGPPPADVRFPVDLLVDYVRVW